VSQVAHDHQTQEACWQRTCHTQHKQLESMHTTGICDLLLASPVLQSLHQYQWYTRITINFQNQNWN